MKLKILFIVLICLMCYSSVLGSSVEKNPFDIEPIEKKICSFLKFDKETSIVLETVISEKVQYSEEERRNMNIPVINAEAGLTKVDQLNHKHYNSYKEELNRLDPINISHVWKRLIFNQLKEIKRKADLKGIETLNIDIFTGKDIYKDFINFNTNRETDFDLDKLDDIYEMDLDENLLGEVSQQNEQDEYDFKYYFESKFYPKINWTFFLKNKTVLSLQGFLKELYMNDFDFELVPSNDTDELEIENIDYRYLMLDEVINEMQSCMHSIKNTNTYAILCQKTYETYHERPFIPDTDSEYDY